jgi:hypothetical protein
MEITVTDEGLDHGAERRRGNRHADREQHGIQSAQVRPGHDVMVVNIGAGGALIETEHRLLPGANVSLILERPQYRASVRGRVLRCSVTRVHPSICFRGAIEFDRSLPWFVEHERVASTQQVV